MFKNYTLFAILLFATATSQSQNHLPYYPLKPDTPKVDFLTKLNDYSTHIGKPFGTFEGMDIKGNKVSSEVLKGKITLVNLWFTGCSGCHYLFPRLNEIYDYYKSNSNFQVITLTPDALESAKSSSLKYNMKYNITLVPALQLDVIRGYYKGYPSSYLVNEKGITIFGHGGFRGINEEVFKEVFVPRIDSLLRAWK